MFVLLTRENDGGAILWKNPLRSCPFSKLCGSRLTSFHVNLLVVRSHPLQTRVLYFTLKKKFWMWRNFSKMCPWHHIDDAISQNCFFNFVNATPHAKFAASITFGLEVRSGDISAFPGVKWVDQVAHVNKKKFKLCCDYLVSILERANHVPLMPVLSHFSIFLRNSAKPNRYNQELNLKCRHARRLTLNVELIKENCGELEWRRQNHSSVQVVFLSGNKICPRWCALRIWRQKVCVFARRNNRAI